MSYKITITATIDDQQKTWDLVHFICRQHGMTEADADVFTVAIGEAYGNGLLYSPENQAELTIMISDDKIEAEIINQGAEINFRSIEEFDTEHDFQMYKDGKLGIPMIKKIVDDVTYSHEKGVNRLVLLKYIKHEPYEVKGENNEN